VKNQKKLISEAFLLISLFLLGLVSLKSLKKVISGELALMACLLAVALFNTFNAGTIVDGGPPPPFWVVLILNPIFCTYGLVKRKK